ncbi:XdhC family protein [Thalassospiraceae bacterium LMO-JJ14]|nr:XdhC family protein [Thalassospiraceae bacterium LMO-JJ14]
MNGRFSEYVLADLRKWRSEGKRAALLTLYNVEPTGPRPAGSQMAVSDAGDFTGFLSGGCVEGALVEETKAAMDAGGNRSIRYGVNSPYFDIALPCGSAIDVYIDIGFADDLLDQLIAAQQARTPVSLITDMKTGESHMADAGSGDDRLQLTLNGDTFDRLYRPPLRLAVAGKGPVLVATAEIASASDIAVHAVTTEDDVARQCEGAGATTSKSLPPGYIDAWTAVATLFHEHELEGPVLEAAMQSDAFYIGALGSRNTHAERVSRFLEDGVSEANVKRIKGPLGISIGSRNPPEIAISLVAEVLMTYRERFPV